MQGESHLPSGGQSASSASGRLNGMGVAKLFLCVTTSLCNRVLITPPDTNCVSLNSDIQEIPSLNITPDQSFCERVREGKVDVAYTKKRTTTGSFAFVDCLWDGGRRYTN